MYSTLLVAVRETRRWCGHAVSQAVRDFCAVTALGSVRLRRPRLFSTNEPPASQAADHHGALSRTGRFSLSAMTYLVGSPTALVCGEQRYRDALTAFALRVISASCKRIAGFRATPFLLTVYSYSPPSVRIVHSQHDRS
jgi:hypothetical protein